ncbi:MAG: amidohydrolase family protein [Bacteroidia bacterium]|nr:amidohydrolase family protein [Bacteroidia bacterium]
MLVITANRIFSPEKWLDNHVLEITDEGSILNLRELRPGEKVQKLGDYLIPGLINAHTHLELSYLKYEIPENTGMAGFAWEVVKSRGRVVDFPLHKKIKAMDRALDMAWEDGVEGFGDIANEELSSEIKEKWAEYFHFHTFIELIGLNAKMAETVVEKGKDLLSKFGKASLTLHAPYSISATLKELVYQEPGPFSIHLLESKEEREVFEKGEGAMVDFFMKLGINFIGMEHRDPQSYLLEGFPTSKKVLWVHLKEASKRHLKQLALIPESWFCLCPRSNVFIHGDGPDINKFLPYSDRVCLGTDSLASNYDLSIWEEVKWIRKHYPEVPFHQLVSWATYNGARALGFDRLGSFEVGNKPGVLAVDGNELQRLF